MEVSRRGFLKLAGTIGAGAVMASYRPLILDILAQAAEVNDYTIAWLQGQGCTGCTISLIQYPDILGALQGLCTTVPFHPTIMPEAGIYAEAVLTDLSPDILVVEGAVPVTEDLGLDTHYCEVFGTPFEGLLSSVASRSTHVVAAGTCAAFGGIAAGSPNPTGARPVSEVLPDKTVINIPGCPAHPDWMVLAIVALVTGEPVLLDKLNRPKAFFGDLLHDNCPRFEAFEANNLATAFPSADACLLNLGCKGAVAYSDCPSRQWNEDTNFCIAAGAPCIGCVYEGFPDDVSPLYEIHDLGLPRESCSVCHLKPGKPKP